MEAVQPGKLDVRRRVAAYPHDLPAQRKFARHLTVPGGRVLHKNEPWPSAPPCVVGGGDAADDAPPDSRHQRQRCLGRQQRECPRRASSTLHERRQGTELSQLDMGRARDEPLRCRAGDRAEAHNVSVRTVDHHGEPPVRQGLGQRADVIERRHAAGTERFQAVNGDSYFAAARPGRSPRYRSGLIGEREVQIHVEAEAVHVRLSSGSRLTPRRLCRWWLPGGCR
ncbi:hypothetical protein D9M72_271050 [compost metagenome]